MPSCFFELWFSFLSPLFCWQVVPYDGLWIDMNEASNFCSAVHCTLPDKPHPGAITDCFLDCSDDNATRWDLPPYK